MHDIDITLSWHRCNTIMAYMQHYHGIAVTLSWHRCNTIMA